MEPNATPNRMTSLNHPDHRTHADRRHSDIGPPSGRPERRLRRRRATDGLKMSCPFCGSSESFVVRSRGTIQIDQVRRRRECVDCGGRFPTAETVDRESLSRELGIDLEDRDAVRAYLEQHAKTDRN